MRARGFTLLELIIVMTIIGILAIVAVPNFIKFQERAEAARIAKEDVEIHINDGTASDMGGLEEEVPISFKWLDRTPILLITIDPEGNMSLTNKAKGSCILDDVTVLNNGDGWEPVR